MTENSFVWWFGVVALGGLAFWGYSQGELFEFFDAIDAVVRRVVR